MTSVDGTNVPNRDVVVSRVGEREVIYIQDAKLEVLEDGSNTDQRIGAISITIPPKTSGPPQHWHQMHDETFLVTSGEITFSSRDKQVVLKAGDYLVVPPMAPHTFANNGDAEATMYNSFTPAYYVNYFRVMSKMIEENDGKMNFEIAKAAMTRYATLPTKMMGYEW